MPLVPPVLDSRTFQQLVARALQRIPHYTPEWTDFNPSDPGVTLIDLFAWLTELMFYQLNRVPDLNFIKFLQLIGLELRPAQPAVADLTFTPQPNANVASVPLGTQVGGQPPGGGQQVVFETQEGLDLIRLPLTDVRAFDGTAYADVTDANGPAGPTYRPFGWVPQVGSALYLGFSQTDPPTTGPLFPRDMRFRLFRSAGTQTGQAQSSAGAESPPTPPVQLVWEYRPSATRWNRLNVLRDETAAFTLGGYILVQGPADPVPTTDADLQGDRIWLRVRLAAGAYPSRTPPEIDALRPNTVNARQLTTVHDESPGLSDGRPGQVFRLLQQPVLADSLQVTVAEPEETAPWKLVPDFLSSGPDDKAYTLDPATGEIQFGDGNNGRIPVDGSEVLAVVYQAGGGAAGNAAAGSLTTLLSPAAGIDSVTNEQSAVGGRDQQDLEDLKRQAPAELRRRSRAVTAEDFATLAGEAGSVARATAIALAHPDHPGVEVAGAVTVVIVPDADEVPPIPSDSLIHQVCQYFQQYRLITTELFVKGPAYTQVKVHAAVSAHSYAAFDVVSKGVQDAINHYLAPLTRNTPSAAPVPPATSTAAVQAGTPVETPPSEMIGGWDFGRDLHPTSLYRVILDVADVVSVDSLALTVGTQPWDRVEDPVVLPPDGLFYGLDHDIAVTPEQDR
jgi:predicted phage baseplate assembly protein